MSPKQSIILRFLALFALAGAVLVVHPIAMQRPAERSRQIVTIDGRPAIAGEVLVKFRRSLALHEWARLRQQTDADRDTGIGGAGARRIHSRRHNTSTLLDFLRSHPDVEYAEPNYILQADATPNDPWFGQLWGLFNTGQVVGAAGTPGADIGATAAWDVSTGSSANTVAVIDTGIDYWHSDLAANVWSASAQFSVTIGEQVIDGQVVGGETITCAAGTHGFNAITRTCDSYDDNGHGTHVAGTIGAAGNNGRGVVGVNWTASIMASKFLGADGLGSVADAIDAIEFVIDAAAVTGTNVRVISNSWGGGGFSQALLDQINRANARDMLFVASAGNTGSDNDLTPRYPSSYNAPNVIAVASTDNKDTIASTSNFGLTSVHLAAPGVNVLSTIPDESYQYLSGTSMAAPHVSGAALLVLSRCALSVSALKDNLLAAVDPIPALSGKVATGGRLNVNTAIHACLPLSDFSLEAAPASQTVVSGASASYTATIVPSGGFTGTVTFSVSGLPPNTTASFSPPSITTSGSSLLTVTSSTSTPEGSFPLTITATSGSLVRTAAVTFTTSVNDPPTAVADTVSTNEDVPAPIAVLANDSDPEGDTLSLIAIGAAQHGLAALNEGGGLTYYPAANYNGQDTFTYTISDGQGATAIGTVTVTIAPVNDAPVASNQSGVTQEDTANGITLTATDVEASALTYVIVSAPAHGTLSGTAPALTYTPAANYNGADSFTFKANDGALDSNVATVSITIAAVDDAPVANPQSVVTDEDVAIAITLTAADVEGSALAYAIVAGPGHGTLSGTPPAVTYTPAPNYNGADSFTFKANASGVDSNVATVAITVTPVDDPISGPLGVDTSVSADGPGTVSTAPFNTVEPGEWLLAFVSSDGPMSGGQTVTVSGAGLPWTLVSRANTQFGTSEIWRARADSILSSATVSSVQVYGAFHQSMTVVAFKGAAGVGATATAGASTGAPSVSLVPTETGSLVYGVGNDWDDAIARVVGPNQTLVHQWVDTSVGDTFWVQALAATAIAGTTVTLNDTSPTTNQWNLAAVEIQPATPVAPPVMSCDVTAPTGGANVFGAVMVSAHAVSTTSVAGVQFQLDGSNLGAEILNPPVDVSIAWDTTSGSNGSHILTCVARAPTGEQAVSGPVTVTVSNVTVPVVVNRTQSDATNLITAAGLTVGPVSTAPSATVPAGSVISQNPLGGTRVAPNTAVALVIATAPQPPSGPVAAYGFNQGSGLQVLDSSGQGNNGTISGATWSTAGKAGAALSFTTNGWVTVPDTASLDLTTGLTLEAWIRPTSNTGWRTVLLKEDAAGLAYGLYSSNGSRPDAYVHTGFDMGLTGTASVPLNTWTHLAVTYDGAMMRMFVNGVQVSSRAVTGNIAATSSPLRIGGNAVWGEYYRGLIDEVRIYNRALSAAEIQSDMTTPIQ